MVCHRQDGDNTHTIDCMSCLIALSRDKPSNCTWKDPSGVTHATYRHESYGLYGAWQALTCSFLRKAGSVQLVKVK